jgi:hypothetical protein
VAATRRPIALRRARLVAQQQRRPHEPHLQQRHDGEQQRHEDADGRALERHAPGHRVVHARQQRGRRRVERQRNGRNRALRDRHAEKASRQPERHHRSRYMAMICPLVAPRHFTHALDLLHEHPRDARQRDAAQDDDDEAVTRSFPPDRSRGRSRVGGQIRPRVDEVVREVVVQRLTRPERSSGSRTASTWRMRLPNAQAVVDGASSKSMKTRGPRLNAPILRPGLPDAPDGERASLMVSECPPRRQAPSAVQAAPGHRDSQERMM